MASIKTRVWHRMSHITGPGAVWLGRCFGDPSLDGPEILVTLRKGQTDGAIKFDLERYLAEVREGVEYANGDLGSNLSVEAIQIVPDDYPTPGQVKYVAYLLTKHAATLET